MILINTLAMTLLASNFQSHLVAFQPNLTVGGSSTPVIQEFNGISPGFAFREMIASWNVVDPDGAELDIEVRAHLQGKTTKWYTMAEWAIDSDSGKRQSVKGQRDEDGTVDTDTLVLAHDAEQIDARVTLKATKPGSHSVLKLVTFSFVNKAPLTPDKQVPSSAWGKTVDVPERAQGNYPNGGVLCSPTSMSMMLWHYSKVLNQPDLNKDVPEVEYHVWDPIYKGAGNWPFNTAYVGSFSGLTSYVTRFTSIQDLEQWIQAGLPVVCSVSFDLLRGLPLSPTESGHLVVLVGFDDKGNPIINDPAFKDKVRKIYPRSDFEKAWKYSKRTVYVVHPSDAPIPNALDGAWFSPSHHQK